MNASGATPTDSFSSPQFPATVFAAAWGLRFGTTTSEQPTLRFEFGRTSGLLLVRLAPGEFGLVLAGRFYNTTLLATIISPGWSIVVDNELLELRWLPQTYQARSSNMWMHLRFDDRAVFADFNRRFWQCYFEAEERVRMLQQRLDLVAHASPSNFTRYCRQYLGEDFFDNLQDSDDESEVQDPVDGDHQSDVEITNAADTSLDN